MSEAVLLPLPRLPSPPQQRDNVLDAGVVPLVALVHAQAEIRLLRCCALTLRNLCRGKPQPYPAQVRPALAALSQLVHSDDSVVLERALWALSYLTDGEDDLMQQVLDSGVCARVVELLLHTVTAVQLPALLAIGNIVSGNDEQTQAAIDADALPCLRALLSFAEAAICKEAAWAVSDICAGPRVHIQAVIDANIPQVLMPLMFGPNADMREEAVRAVNNATSGGSPEQIEVLVQCGAVGALGHVLSLAGFRELRIAAVAVEGIENILRAGDIRFGPGTANVWVQVCKDASVPESLAELQSIQNDTIADKAARLLATWFFGDEAPHELEELN